MRKQFKIKLPNSEILLGEKTLIMGILNITPDSFSDGGKFIEVNKAVEHALQMIHDGADIIDIGGESTRPGANNVSPTEEKERVIPIIRAIRKQSEIPISIDTYKADVARDAIRAGANIINDISGCRFDKDMAPLAAEKNIPTIIMHIKGTPKDMQKDPIYGNIIEEIKEYLLGSINTLTEAGLPKSQIIIDPGIGFGKTTEHNLTIMNNIDRFADLDCPILIGASRKSVIGNIISAPPKERAFGTAATVTANIMKGAHIVRVHDVKEMRQVAEVTDAIINAIH